MAARKLRSFEHHEAYDSKIHELGEERIDDAISGLLYLISMNPYEFPVVFAEASGEEYRLGKTQPVRDLAGFRILFRIIDDNRIELRGVGEVPAEA